MLSAFWTSRSSAQFEAQRSARTPCSPTSISSTPARFQYPFINLGLVPEFGTSFSLPDQVGYLRAAEMVLLGHPFDASSALSMGLVTKVLPNAEVFAGAERVAQELAQKPLAALKASKQLLRRQVRSRVEQATRQPRTKWRSSAKECVRRMLVRRLLLFLRSAPLDSIPAKPHTFEAIAPFGTSTEVGAYRSRFSATIPMVAVVVLLLSPSQNAIGDSDFIFTSFV
jgi:hypothetical protein